MELPPALRWGKLPAMRDKLRHVTVIGVGLLGGSAALALKACDPSVRIAGVGRRRESLQMALDAGAIDTAHLDPAPAVVQSDLVILATPVGAFARHLREIAPHLRRGAAVTDVGSTKSAVVRQAERLLGAGGPFVGSHPMAGSEQKGVSFARADLFAGATCIVTPSTRTPPRLVRRIERFWQLLGTRTVRMGPAEHDRAVAAISHLPHVLASLLMLLPDSHSLQVAATGFRDATRLAGGDPEMWRDILLTNRRAILGALDRFDERLMHLRDLLEMGDARELEKLLTLAKKRRADTLLKEPVDRRLAAE
ncbi:MAG: T-protein [Planctomycetes bacterium ADurb.Bin126]|nr:MAG: T-protein [Planctomycetes bacterium ADurb.Bin126]